MNDLALVQSQKERNKVGKLLTYEAPINNIYAYFRVQTVKMRATSTRKVRQGNCHNKITQVNYLL